MSKTSKKLYGETLIQDFIKFFEEDNNYDLEIKVGEEPNIKIFRGHSQIFIARSSYFKSAFTREWQNPILSTDPSKWSEENIESMKSTLKNFIPLVRFFTLNSDKFHRHIRPYEKILGDIYEQVLKYHLVKVWKPKGIEILPRRNIIYSKLLRHDHVKKIKKQIYSKNYIRSFPTKDPYDLVLLEPSQYESLCLCPTITVFRIPELDLIIGGYNPFQTEHYNISYPPSLKLKAESSFMFRIIGKKIEFISALGTRDFDLKSHYITPLNIFDFKFHGSNRKISYRQHFYHSLLNYSHLIYKNSYDIEGLQVFEVIKKIY
ncbi:39288_t:CDS:2 [Gigaspora margarita]|uniref:39288_t:CDS:1 n=1 Tax=Gigaspora margarita TaxID=4874 RepID=A0ABN7V038_GIGMA|nr:39288_t:CDS:2 [Gigaspora margarita]